MCRCFLFAIHAESVVSITQMNVLINISLVGLWPMILPSYVHIYSNKKFFSAHYTVQF